MKRKSDLAVGAKVKGAIQHLLLVPVLGALFLLSSCTDAMVLWSVFGDSIEEAQNNEAPFESGYLPSPPLETSIIVSKEPIFREETWSATYSERLNFYLVEDHLPDPPARSSNVYYWELSQDKRRYYNRHRGIYLSYHKEEAHPNEYFVQIYDPNKVELPYSYLIYDYSPDEYLAPRSITDMPVNATDMNNLLSQGLEYVEISSQSELSAILLKYVDNGHQYIGNGDYEYIADSSAEGLMPVGGMKRSTTHLRRVTDQDRTMRAFNEGFVIENGGISRRLSRRELENVRKAKRDAREEVERAAEAERRAKVANHCVSLQHNRSTGLMTVRNGCTFTVNMKVCTKSKTSVVMDLITGGWNSYGADGGYDCSYQTVGPNAVGATFFWYSEPASDLSKLLSSAGYKITASRL